MRNFSRVGNGRGSQALANLLNSDSPINWLDRDFQRRLQMTLMRRDFNANDFELLQQLDEEISMSRSRGANQEVIDRLPSHTVSRAEAETRSQADVRSCSVCLGPFEEGDILRTLLCLHQFHQHCIDHWLRQNATCPICKASAVET